MFWKQPYSSTAESQNICPHKPQSIKLGSMLVQSRLVIDCYKKCHLEIWIDRWHWVVFVFQLLFWSLKVFIPPSYICILLLCDNQQRSKEAKALVSESEVWLWIYSLRYPELVALAYLQPDYDSSIETMINWHVTLLSHDQIQHIRTFQPSMLELRCLMLTQRYLTLSTESLTKCTFWVTT